MRCTKHSVFIIHSCLKDDPHPVKREPYFTYCSFTKAGHKNELFTQTFRGLRSLGPLISIVDPTSSYDTHGESQTART